MDAEPVNALSGSITVEPGQTSYVSFGTVNTDDVLLWSLVIDTWSTVYQYWIEAPNGQHIAIESLTWGYIATAPGEWWMGFSVDASGYWNLYVDYVIYAVAPQVKIASPEEGDFVNSYSLTVAGTVDGFADQVSVSLDDVHYEEADLYLGTWSKPMTLPADGEYTVYSEGMITWGSYWVKYYDSITITVDTQAPTVVMTVPADSTNVRGNYADIGWQCADECGIAKTEMKVDGWGWETVQGTEYLDLYLSTGTHTIQIRVTDLAGNQASDTVTFDVDARALSFSGPYYGLPIVAIVLAVIITGAVVFLMLRKRRGGPAVASVPKEEPAVQAP